MEFEQGKNYTVLIPNGDPKLKRIFLLFFLLKQHIEASKLQFERINWDLTRNNQGRLHIDIHFLLISIGNILKIFKSLRAAASRNGALVSLYKKYHDELERLDTIRDDLEHMEDKRLEGLDKKGNPLADSGNLGAFKGGKYNFGGKEMDIQETKALVKTMEEELDIWEKAITTPGGI